MKLACFGSVNASLTCVDYESSHSKCPLTPARMCVLRTPI